MGCCKCRYFEWPDPQEVVWKEPADEQEYCVFHAPSAGTKRKELGVGGCHTRSSFNTLVFKRINDARRSSNYCILSGTVFPWEIEFETPDIAWTNKIIFHSAIFYDEVIFSNISFVGSIVFSKTVFHAKATYINVEFEGDAKFNETQFIGQGVFYLCNFKNEAEFVGLIAHDFITFENTFFGAPVNFSRCRAKNSSIRMISIGVDLLGPSRWCHNSSRSPQAALANVKFTSIEVPLFCFQGCYWPERLELENHGTGETDNLQACEELYRTMKQRAAQEHDQPMVSAWHYREKLMTLKQSVRWNSSWSWEFVRNLWPSHNNRSWLAAGFLSYILSLCLRSSRSLTFWYWATSGFGERAVRAGVWLVALVALSFALNATPQPIEWNSMWGATAANATLATIPFAKDIPGEGWVKVGRGLWQFLIAIQFTLFALAVRNRFRR